jgi:hypothetical protein
VAVLPGAAAAPAGGRAQCEGVLLVRTLSAPLLAAQKASKRKPFFYLRFSDRLAQALRLRWSSQYTGAEPDGPHAAVVGSDGSLNRFRVESGTLYRQRVGSPAPGSDFSDWTSFATNRGAVAVAAAGSVISIVVVRTDGGTPNREVWLNSSVNNGVTWLGWALAFTAPAAITHLALGAKGNGDLAVFFDYGALVRRIKRVSSVWGAQANWTNTAASITGLACHYWADFDLVVTGTVPTSLEPTVWCCIYGDGYSQALDTWSALLVYAQAAAWAGVAYSRPSLQMFDCYRITYREAYTGTGAYDRVMITTLAPGEDFVVQAWADATPIDLTATYGLALAGFGTRGWCCTPARVFCSGESVYTDLASRLVALDVIDGPLEPDGGWVELDNHDGALNEANLGGTGLEGLRLGGQMDFSPGYYVAGGSPVTSPGLRFWVRGLEWRVSAARSVLRVLVGSPFWLLLGESARTSEWAVGTQTVYGLIRSVVTRAGLGFAALSASPAASNMQPAFALRAGQQLLAAARELLGLVEDDVIASGENVYLIWPQVSDATDYAYGTDHGVLSLRSALAERPSVFRAFGVAADGSPVLGESIDWDAVEDVMWPAVRFRRAAGTASEAATLASADARWEDCARQGGELVVPPNVGQEPWDVIEVTEPRLGWAAVKRRVRAVRYHYDRDRALFEMRLALGGL